MGQACNHERLPPQRSLRIGLSNGSQQRPPGFQYLPEASAYEISSRSEVSRPSVEKSPVIREKSSEAWPVIRMDILHREHMALLQKAGLQLSSWLHEDGTITPQDTLLIMDMQNDFFPGKFAPGGGRAAVPEGESVIDPVVDLIEAFSRCGALIVAARAFHPADHTSFYEQGGPVPSHCVQSTCGSNFHPSIAEALQQAHAAPLRQTSFNGLPGEAGKVEIVFKGFLNDVPSPGAFRYDRELCKERLKHHRLDMENDTLPRAMSPATWTGAMALKCSNLTNDINASPDVAALLQKDLRPLEDIVPKSGRLLIAGLTLDGSVLDSAVAASRLGYDKVFVAVDASRPAHFGMSGEYGSGFLTDPAFIVSELQKHCVNIVQSAEILRTFSREPTEVDIDGPVVADKVHRPPSPQRGGA